MFQNWAATLILLQVRKHRLNTAVTILPIFLTVIKLFILCIFVLHFIELVHEILVFNLELHIAFDQFLIIDLTLLSQFELIRVETLPSFEIPYHCDSLESRSLVPSLDHPNSSQTTSHSPDS